MPRFSVDPMFSRQKVLPGVAGKDFRNYPVVSLRSTTGYLLQSRRDKYTRQAKPTDENRKTPNCIDRLSSGLRCDRLCLPHHSQEVPAHDLMDLSGSIATVEHFLRDHRICRNVVQLFRKH